MCNQVTINEKMFISGRITTVAKLVQNLHQCTSCPWFVTLHRKALCNWWSVLDIIELWASRQYRKEACLRARNLEILLLMAKSIELGSKMIVSWATACTDNVTAINKKSMSTWHPNGVNHRLDVNILN